jgi:hypothetical protein
VTDNEYALSQLQAAGFYCGRTVPFDVFYRSACEATELLAQAEAIIEAQQAEIESLKAQLETRH